MWKFIRRLGLALGIVYIVLIAVVIIFDGRAFDLPNHKLLIYDTGFHLYDKAIMVEFEAAEE